MEAQDAYASPHRRSKWVRIVWASSASRGSPNAKAFCNKPPSLVDCTFPASLSPPPTAAAFNASSAMAILAAPRCFAQEAVIRAVSSSATALSCTFGGTSRESHTEHKRSRTELRRATMPMIDTPVSCSKSATTSPSSSSKCATQCWLCRWNSPISSRLASSLTVTSLASSAGTRSSCKSPTRSRTTSAPVLSRVVCTTSNTSFKGSVQKRRQEASQTSGQLSKLPPARACRCSRTLSTQVSRILLSTAHVGGQSRLRACVFATSRAKLAVSLVVHERAKADPNSLSSDAIASALGEPGFKEFLRVSARFFRAARPLSSGRPSMAARSSASVRGASANTFASTAPSEIASP
mmetsp:Transcript_30024/g.80135  ORF Transcript_30024/g.80135 Transcript_30024/m.80135 type:complete len:351 (+) Transcript_30024:1034-2086(+)